jgi:hypothetical protein
MLCALIAFLRFLRRRSAELKVVFDQPRLPRPARRLLALAPIGVGPEAKSTARGGLPVDRPVDPLQRGGDVVVRKERDSFVEQASDPTDAAIAVAMNRRIDRLTAQISTATPGQDHDNIGVNEAPSTRVAKLPFRQ